MSIVRKSLLQSRRNKNSNFHSFQEYNAGKDPYAHLRHSKPKKEKQAPSPGIRRITRETYIERVEASRKCDGIPLSVVDGNGKIVEQKLLRTEDLDIE